MNSNKVQRRLFDVKKQENGLSAKVQVNLTYYLARYWTTIARVVGGMRL
ncbi:hypothetical protein J4233_05495 [Candidatus Pacearchaeota archaeon]|nr:hypothetical protein [uncultured archaeon]AQS28897.1 hypothetical protein [uncultured archaeon]MBS3077695.1 hypothetical protein [Candidatus Pacearchaeota archaeon]